MANNGHFELPKAVGDIVIVGAGLAGLFTALKLAPLPVTIISPTSLGQSASSAWAQGGIAAAVAEGDSPDRHADDTIRAGAGLVDKAVAHLVTSEANARVRDLLTYGVPFDRDLSGHFLLSREAAHSRARVVRVAGDKAGAAIMQALIGAVRATPSIAVIEGFSAVGLIKQNDRVNGLLLVREDDAGAVYRIEDTRAVVLATGGLGGLYAVTTNPAHCRGEGLALAARAGAVIADAEFVQFHPTALAVGLDPAPLATEALRGEGAVLVNSHGTRFMQARHPDAELAPRDVVARGVFREIAAGRGAFLDCRSIGPRMADFFPTVYGYCRNAGLDPVTQPIPVAPAAHYHMGGIRTDTSGRTRVAGLWAVGEVAATGLHGANRLASNSLLEALVFAARSATDIASLGPAGATAGVIRARATHLPDFAAREAAIRIIRTTMAEHVGVERDADGLAAALKMLSAVAAAADGDPVIANATLAARFVAESALRRKESRGAHARSDFPHPDPKWQRHSTMTLAGLDLRSALRDQGIAAIIGAPLETKDPE